MILFLGLKRIPDLRACNDGEYEGQGQLDVNINTSNMKTIAPFELQMILTWLPVSIFPVLMFNDND